MPDERQDSIRQGVNAPEQSPEGQAAAEERRRKFAEGPAFGGGMGGTSDAETPGEEAGMEAALSEAEERDRTERERTAQEAAARDTGAPG